MKQQRQATLDLEIGTDPIAGRLHDEQGSCVHFSGWLELAVALERLLRPTKAPASGLTPLATVSDEEEDGRRTHRQGADGWQPFAHRGSPPHVTRLRRGR